MPSARFRAIGGSQLRRFIFRAIGGSQLRRFQRFMQCGLTVSGFFSRYSFFVGIYKYDNFMWIQISSITPLLLDILIVVFYCAPSSSCFSIHKDLDGMRIRKTYSIIPVCIYYRWWITPMPVLKVVIINFLILKLIWMNINDYHII